MFSKKTEKIIELIIFLLMLILLVQGVYILNMGTHNIDLSWNFYRLNNNLVDTVNTELKQQNISFEITTKEPTDIASDFIERPISSYYILGHNQVIRGFFESLFAVGIIGIIIGRRF